MFLIVGFPDWIRLVFVCAGVMWGLWISRSGGAAGTAGQAERAAAGGGLAAVTATAAGGGSGDYICRRMPTQIFIDDC